MAASKQSLIDMEEDSISLWRNSILNKVKRRNAPLTRADAIRLLDTAKKHLERVQTAAWDPKDPDEAITWGFYAYETALVAVAELNGLSWEK